MRAGITNEYDKICRLIDENHIISFDIYDTALLRNVLYPTDIFDLVQIEIDKLALPITDFKKMRIKAEETARLRSRFDDVRYDEIYTVISEQIGKELAETLNEIELRIERKFTTFNPFIKKIYDYAVSKGKVILFISDIYLEPSFVKKILEVNGYSKNEGIYVSGYIGVSKASKGLFRHIQEQRKFNSAWLHIGDNEASDYQNAVECGLNAYYYKALRDRVVLPGNYSIEYSIMKAIQINFSETTLEDYNYWYRFGVNVVSSLFFGFTNWLAKELKGKSNVYFLSRDGYLPWKLYNKFAEHFGDLPKSKYIYASRKVYQLSTIADMDSEEALELLVYSNQSLGQIKTVIEVFDDMGIQLREHHLKQLDQLGLRLNKPLVTSEDIDKMKQLIRKIYPEVISCQEHNKSLVIEYLRQNEIFKHSELNVVDIGWRGSTQKAIKDITNKKINGFYFGTSYNVYDEIRSEVNSYSFHLGKPFQFMQAVMGNVMMFEFIFSAPHGTLTGFKKISGKIYPVLSEDNSSLPYVIEQVHSGVLRIADEYLNYMEYLRNIQVHEALRDYLEFIDAKEYEDLLYFKDLSLSVGFSELSKPLQFVTCVSIQEYLRNRKRIEKEAAKNLWRGAIIVEGSSAEFKKSHKKRSWIKLKFFSKDRLLKALRNPKKAYRYLIRLIK
jgi:HAD superfamily hydrolase (TIGR01549 family)